MQCIPVRYRGRVIAVAHPRGADDARAGGRASSSATTSRCSTASPGWSPRATFPFAREEIELEGAPRVGDGVILLDADARMRYASPNAVSSLHRMGIHAYTSRVHLAEIGFDEAAVRHRGARAAAGDRGGRAGRRRRCCCG